VPAFRIKQDVLPGRYVQAWFQPTQTGRFHLFCAEFCGTNHSGMIGTVVVMEPQEFQDWLDLQAEGSPAIAIRATPRPAGLTLLACTGKPCCCATAG
jgi:cytochrome c oxidase subunit 2